MPIPGSTGDRIAAVSLQNVAKFEAGRREWIPGVSFVGVARNLVVRVRRGSECGINGENN